MTPDVAPASEVPPATDVPSTITEITFCTWSGRKLRSHLITMDLAHSLKVRHGDQKTYSLENGRSGSMLNKVNAKLDGLLPSVRSNCVRDPIQETTPSVHFKTGNDSFLSSSK